MRIEHVEIGAGGVYEQSLPEGWTCIVYVRRGTVAVGGEEVAMHETCQLARRGGDGLSLACVGGQDADVLVLAGEPLGAPVVASGTMVMNSQARSAESHRELPRLIWGVARACGLALPLLPSLDPPPGLLAVSHPSPWALRLRSYLPQISPISPPYHTPPRWALRLRWTGR